jgi:hypothetical protein
MVVSLLMHAIYFPDHGSMLLKAGGLGKYNPQLCKPAADARGADQMDYSKVNTVEKVDEKTDA